MNAMAKELGIDKLTAKIERLEYLIVELAEDRRPQYYTLAQAAIEWGKSPRTVGRWVAEGKIPVTRIGKTPMIHRDIINQGV